VRDINKALHACVADGCSLRTTGFAPWAQLAAGRHAINGYRHFAGPVSIPAGAVAAAATARLEGMPHVAPVVTVHPHAPSAVTA
jgi:hypothetical protein